MPLDRRLVAVMFTDMVVYTTLIQADERLALNKRERYVGALVEHRLQREQQVLDAVASGLSEIPGIVASVASKPHFRIGYAPRSVRNSMF